MANPTVICKNNIQFQASNDGNEAASELFW